MIKGQYTVATLKPARLAFASTMRQDLLEKFRELAAAERRTITVLLDEALTMLLESRGKRGPEQTK